MKSETPLSNNKLTLPRWFLLIPVNILRRHTETVLMGHEAP